MMFRAPVVKLGAIIAGCMLAGLAVGGCLAWALLWLLYGVPR